MMSAVSLAAGSFSVLSKQKLQQTACSPKGTLVFFVEAFQILLVICD